LTPRSSVVGLKTKKRGNLACGFEVAAARDALGTLLVAILAVGHLQDALFGIVLVSNSAASEPADRLPKSSPSAVALQDQADVAELVPEVSGGNRLSVGTHEERLVEEGTQEVEVAGLRLVESG
jgi:hypothetical protein